MRSRASFMSSGVSDIAVSPMASTPVPPAPNSTTGPNVGSVEMPRINS